MKKLRKPVSVLLAVLMVVSMIPATCITVFADTMTTDMRSLGRGFNMLGNVSLSTFSTKPSVFNSDYKFSVDRTTGSETIYQSTYINDISTYVQNETKKLDASLSLKTGSKLVSFEITAKLGLTQSSSSDTTKNTEYCLIEAQKITTSNTLQIGTTTSAITKLWDNGAIRSDFYDELKSIETDADIENFFATYGTHIITKYNAGAYGYASYSGKNLSSKLTEASTGTANVASGLTIGSMASLNATLGTSTETSSENDTANKIVNTAGKASGSTVGLTINKDTTASSIENFFKNVTDQSSEILVDENLKLLPIWELLVKEEDADIRVRLEQYFSEHINEQMDTFYEDYVYSSISTTDYSDYTLISTASQLNNIRNQLDGKYVLLCDIDLSEYAAWSPIGTKEAPFTGIFDGNGNTVSGLSVIPSVDHAAGLFGYNDGEIRGVILSGNVNVTESGNGDTCCFGGIVGVNNGTVSSCINQAEVTGKVTVTTTETDDSSEETWFDINQTAIENAKLTEVTVATDDTVYSTFPLKLTGTANNVTINVPASGKVAFIILENADISGSIHSENDNTRSVCIISMGDCNKLTAPNDTVAVNVPNASLYITGDAELTIKGGNGYTSDGKTGNDGTNGNSGCEAVTADNVYLLLDTVNIIGGDGGKGGAGSAGKDGTDGRNGVPYWSGSVISDYEATSGTAGGDGGDGGDGGLGATALCGNVTTYGNTKVTIICGCAGVGGNGGKGGDGGKGGNGGSNTTDNRYGGTFGVADHSYMRGKDGANGGNGGYGGNGGDTASTTYYSFNDSLNICGNSAVIIKQADIITDISSGGEAGSGGARGDGGVAYYWSMADGNSQKYGSNGTAGNSGYKGGVGKGNSVGNNNTIAQIITHYKEYSVVNYGAPTFAEAQSKANESDAKLVSIGSEREQTIITKLLSYAPDGNYWIGLQRDETLGYNIFKWEDDALIRIEEDTFGESANAMRINTDGDEICNAYTNWADGEPNNTLSNEPYVSVNSSGQWNDLAESNKAYIIGYITEKDLGTSSANLYNKNSMLLGGVCGFNSQDGTITDCINEASVQSNGIEAENVGVSSYSAGIAGYSLGKINGCMNNGGIKAFSLTDSTNAFSDSYAVNIANGTGTSENCIGNANTDSIAISANALSDNHVDVTQQGVIGNDPTVTLNTLWENRPMHIENINTDTVYLPGGSFDRNSVTVTVNGTEVPKNKMLTNYYFSKKGVTAVAITYSGYTRTVLASVNDIEPISLEIEKVKTEYIVGDTFSTESLIFRLVYNDGSTKTITGNNALISITAPNLNSTGEKNITVKYDNSLTATYVINVQSIEITEIAVQTMPTKVQYEIGEALDTNGLVLLISYSDGSSKTVTTGYSTSDFSSATAGTKSVTVSYGGKTTSYQVTVKEKTIVDEDAPKIVLENQKVCDNSEFTIAVGIQNNPGIISLRNSVSYNTDVFELISVENTGMLNGYTTPSATISSPYALRWADSLATQNNIQNGTIIKLTFKVKTDTPEGKYTIVVNPIEARNVTGEKVTFLSGSADIEVVHYMTADADGDCEITDWDAILFERYLAGWTVDINLAAMDIDKDGEVSDWDAILLERYLAGWDVKIE